MRFVRVPNHGEGQNPKIAGGMEEGNKIRKI
jgi:hypothetical protein